MFNTSANVPKTEIDRRIQRLQKALDDTGLNGALILQNADLYYFCGTIQQALCYIPVQGDPILMVKKSVQRARSESSIQKITPIQSPGQFPEILNTHGYPEPLRLGMELDVLPTNLYLRYQKMLKHTVINDVSDSIRRLRAVKSSYEIKAIRRAANLADRVAEFAATVIREGVSEIELAGKIEAEARRLGHQGLIRMRLWGSEMFYGHFMSGPSAALPSYLASPTGGGAMSPAFSQGPGFKTVAHGEPVLLDYVFAFQGYLADHTRIFSIGRLPDKLRTAHTAMLELQSLVAQNARPGAKAGDLYDLAVEFVQRKGYSDVFMGADDQRVRFIGHGIGLELDDYPFLAAGQTLELEEGMVIALEPKLIFPSEGVVGIENTHLVTAGGLEKLTRFEDEIVTL